MQRRIVTTLAAAALLAFVSAQAAQQQTGNTQSDQTTEQAVERTGEKTAKPVQTSCPIHPEIKARSAAKCPKCRMAERKQQDSRVKDKNKVQPQPQAQEGAAANE